MVGGIRAGEEEPPRASLAHECANVRFSACGDDPSRCRRPLGVAVRLREAA